MFRRKERKEGRKKHKNLLSRRNAEKIGLDGEQTEHTYFPKPELGRDAFS